MTLTHKNFFAAWSDLFVGIMQWRVWGVLALSELKSRYRRSSVGQFWITLSMSITILCLGFVYSAIFRAELSVYLPFMAVSFIAWTFIASIVTDSASAFVEAETYIRSTALPRSIFLYKNLLRNLLSFAHNLVLVPIVLLTFSIKPSWAMLLFIPAVALTLLNGLWIGMFLGTLCARFRDLPQIVANGVQIAFFASPVIWGRPQLSSDHHYLIDYNPFAILLELLREPLLGKAPALRYWVVAVLITVLGMSVALAFFARFRARIAYYV